VRSDLVSILGKPDVEKENEEEKIDHASEIKKISKYLEPNERVLLIARQSRIMPGGAKITPNTVFATDRKIIIRNPLMLGIKEEVLQIPYTSISAVNLEKGVFTSEVSIMAPGMSEEINRFLKPNKKGMPAITAIPNNEAVQLAKIIEQGKSAATMGRSMAASSPLDELKKLKELLDNGAITQDEYDAKKKEILDKV
jgi:hypothetical protein